MKLFFVNNDGGGFADTIAVDDGLSVAQLFELKMPGRKSQDYLIRVNRLPAPSDQVLREGDRVTFSPTKVMGAHINLTKAA